MRIRLLSFIQLVSFLKEMHRFAQQSMFSLALALFFSQAVLNISVPSLALAAPKVVAVPVADTGRIVLGESLEESEQTQTISQRTIENVEVIKRRWLPQQVPGGEFRVFTYFRENGICGERGAWFIFSVQVRYEIGNSEKIWRPIKMTGVPLAQVESYRVGQPIPSLRSFDFCDFGNSL